MKRPILLLSGIIASIVIVSCANEPKPVASTSDYEQYLRSTGKVVHAENHHASISFWESRVRKNKDDLTSILKLAGLHAESFKQKGNITDIFISDSLYRKVLNESGFNHASIYQSLATNSISRHEFWTAKKYAEEALSIGENRSASLLILTDVLLELGNLDSASLILNSFTNKNSFAWLIRQSKVLDHKGDLDSAIVLMEKAHALVIRNENLYCWSKSNLADMYGHAGRVNDSYNAFLDVLKKRPDYDYALKGIAWILFSNDHKPEEAKKLIQYLVSRKPSPDYYLLLAEIEESIGNFDDAERNIQRFIECVSSPRYGNMYNRHRALLYAEGKGKSGQAVVLAKADIQVRPTAESYALLAWCLYHNDQEEKAREIIENYVEGNTFEPESLFQAGMILKTADTARSKNYLEDALTSAFELGPSRTKQIRHALRNL